jgi:peptidoglycan/LPS O-acetylase OafA/YrhL
MGAVIAGPDEGELTRFPSIPALDGVRSIAVLGVLGLHLEQSFLVGGYLGVDVFFVLSGFLITGLLATELAGTDGVGLRRFYARRALRLLPALVVFLVICVALARPLRIGPSARELALVSAGVLGYVANWMQAAGWIRPFGSIAHTWTLAIEEQFYLLWPPLLVFLRRRIGVRGVIAVCVAGAIASAADLALSWDGRATPPAYYRTDSRAGALLVGCAVGLAFVRWPGRASGTTAFAVRASGLAGLVLLVGGMWSLNSGRDASLVFRGGIQLAWITSALVIAMVVWAPWPALDRLFGCRPARVLARLSYALYLWHIVVYRLVDLVLDDQRDRVTIPIKLALSLGVAAASWWAVEAPMLRRRDRSAGTRVVGAPVPQG